MECIQCVLIGLRRVSLEQIILIAALKLPASNLVDTAAASLLFSVDFLVGLLSTVGRLVADTMSLSHAATRLLITLL